MKKGLIKNKRAQHTMGLPFGMIFAIFLIVIFIVIAFIAINHFLDIGKCSSVGMFYDELQREVDSVWASQESKSDFEINLPSGILKICFANLSADAIEPGEDYDAIKDYEIYEANVFLLPPGEACNMPYKMIEHINITKITESQNPKCFDVSRDLIIEKGFYEKFVMIS